MAATFNDLSMIQYHNDIRIFNCRQPVSDNKYCSALHQSIHTALYDFLRSRINGNTRCTGHSECDAIIMDEGVVSAIPELTAANIDASLIHEAAIGKIAGEQLVKLMTLGLTEEEAEAKIIEGFLK